VTTEQIVLGIVIGVVAGVLSGLFGVGGGIITTPAIQELLGGSPYIAVGTPLPVAIPTALVGGYTYARAREVSWRAVRFAAIPGMAAAAAGAWLTSLIDPHWLLLVTAVLIGWQAVRIGRSARYRIRERGTTPGWQYAVLGGFTGLVSGLLGVGGGIVFVPFVTTMLGMPLKRALGTSWSSSRSSRSPARSCTPPSGTSIGRSRSSWCSASSPVRGSEQASRSGPESAP
jgi:uncharacterized membrane protein YfcA